MARKSIGYRTFWANLNLIAPWVFSRTRKNRPLDDLARRESKFSFAWIYLDQRISICGSWLYLAQARVCTLSRHCRGRKTMKIRYADAPPALAGPVLDATAILTLHAEAKPPVSVIAFNEDTNQDG